jgi:hypothetical protein
LKLLLVNPRANDGDGYGGGNAGPCGPE